jgi:hypothetical protein
MNESGYASVVTRNATTKSWTETFIWNNTNQALVYVRSPACYTDPITGVVRLFAGGD